MKKLISYILLLMLLGFAPKAVMADSPIDFTNIPIPGISIPMQSLTEMKICQARRIFCGQTGAVMIAAAIFLLGIGIVNNRVHWATVILVISGITIFYFANDIARVFLQANFVAAAENPLCSCECNVDLFSFSSNDLKKCVQEMNTEIYNPF